MYLRGDLQLEREGQPAERYTRLGLCRCGASENKPFCDGHHARAGFTDPGCLAADAADESPEPAAGVLALKCAPDGPVVFSGQLEIRDAEGRTVVRSQGALCRCGGSANKPFCDGSHRKLGFRG